jgi:hypothetical protein
MLTPPRAKARPPKERPTVLTQRQMYFAGMPPEELDVHERAMCAATRDASEQGPDGLPWCLCWFWSIRAVPGLGARPGEVVMVNFAGGCPAWIAGKNPRYLGEQYEAITKALCEDRALKPVATAIALAALPTVERLRLRVVAGNPEAESAAAAARLELLH